MLSFHDCCVQVFEHCPDEYAKAYAKAGLTLHGADEVRVQALYILNNMQHWRGERARSVRARLKEIGKPVTR